MSQLDSLVFIKGSLRTSCDTKMTKNWATKCFWPLFHPAFEWKLTLRTLNTFFESKIYFCHIKDIVNSHLWPI